ncbi:MAG TPA: lysophospholipid acyltransferase family protein [Terriglobales bacterium]|nr:lysophospholipid acyltransferase family protein [Terriglobales bacterium]
MGLRAWLRTARRCFWVLSIAGLALLDFAWRRSRRNLDLSQRAIWLQQYCRMLLPHLGVRWDTSGQVPTTGLVVSNHLSYLDILVFSAAMGCSFVSKAEVRDWPLFGPFAKLSGTVFVWRHSAADSARAYRDLTECLKTGHPVALFPEATTTDGTYILPFRSTMFQAAIDAGVPITAACIGYSPLEDGSVANDICFWGDHQALPHAMNLFSKRRIECHLRFDEALPHDGDRKQLAKRAYERVTSMALTSA